MFVDWAALHEIVSVQLQLSYSVHMPLTAQPRKQELSKQQSQVSHVTAHSACDSIEPRVCEQQLLEYAHSAWEQESVTPAIRQEA